MTSTLIVFLLWRILLKSSYFARRPFPYMVQVNECDAVKILFAIYPSVILTSIMLQSHMHLEYHVGGIIRERPKFILKITGCQ